MFRFQPWAELAGVDAYELMRGLGNLCVGGDDEGYEPRRLVALLLDGLRN